MQNVIAETAEELSYMIDHTHVLSDEGVLDRIRQIERLLWTRALSKVESSRLRYYLRALVDEATKRMKSHES